MRTGTSSSLNLTLDIVPSAVPLPPAAWTALVSLPLLALAVYRSRNRAMN